MKKKFELSVEWRTNEYYMMDTVTLLLDEEKIGAIEKAQTTLKENPDFDSIRIMIDENCISSDSDLHRLGYGFVIVCAGDDLYFIGTDHYDSSNQVETEGFTLKEFPLSEIEDFIDAWGQTHDEICAELGYDEDDDGSSEMLLGDGYKWFERYQKWFPKSSSMYDKREQEIFDYINLKYC
jgi:hypothetical protein